MTSAGPKPYPILVTAAVIRRGDKILIAQRLANATMEASKWEFPGGKVEHGEHPEACLRREIREELALEIEVGELLGVSSHVEPVAGRSAVHIVLLCYWCKHISGEVQLIEVQDARWISIDELSKFDFASADIPFLRLITKA